MMTMLPTPGHLTEKSVTVWGVLRTPLFEMHLGVGGTRGKSKPLHSVGAECTLGGLLVSRGKPSVEEPREG